MTGEDTHMDKRHFLSSVHLCRYFLQVTQHILVRHKAKDGHLISVYVEYKLQPLSTPL